MAATERTLATEPRAPEQGDAARPRLLVYSSLFPHARAPQRGLFIRNRMFRVAEHLPVTVVSPQPWFPWQAALRMLRPHFRPPAARHERQQGIDVYLPRFPSAPAVGKRHDGWLMARATLPLLRRLRDRFDIIDAHFAYPDGYAATLLGRWLGVPVWITLRGTEQRLAQTPWAAQRIGEALQAAHGVIAVSSSLRDLAVSLGCDPGKVTVVGNGVDTALFRPRDRTAARRALGLPQDARVLVTVGALCERKGFHRVIDCLPELRRRLGDVHYLCVGGPSPEGDWTERLAAQVRELRLTDVVHFLGPREPEELPEILSAADCFVLASRNEGWANVLLEAMACGLPVVATDVGGNAEVVCRPELGRVVPFGDHEALADAAASTLADPPPRDAVLAHARANAWEQRVAQLVGLFVSAGATGPHHEPVQGLAAGNELLEPHRATREGRGRVSPAG